LSFVALTSSFFSSFFSTFGSLAHLSSSAGSATRKRNSGLPFSNASFPSALTSRPLKVSGALITILFCAL
jgi:hypothetical protein